MLPHCCQQCLWPSELTNEYIVNIVCHHRGFLTYEHTGDPADLIVSKYALHHLPDFWKSQALARMSDMLRAGGVLYLRDVIFSFHPSEAHERISRWIDAVSSPAGTGWSRADFETRVREEYSTYSWTIERMIQEARLKITEAKYHDLKTYAEYVCFRTEQAARSCRKDGAEVE